MEVKIKNNGEMLDATIEMVDGVMVVSPKEVKFEPKDGDVVTYMNGDKATIYVFAGGYKYNTSFSSSVYCVGHNLFPSNILIGVVKVSPL